MAINEILSGAQSSPGWDLIKSITSYYGLRDYLSFRYHETFHPENIRRYESYSRHQNHPGEKYFWKDVQCGDLIAGSKVELKAFQISPWFPRKPGLYWTYNAAQARQRAYGRHLHRDRRGSFVFDVHGKTLMSELGGVGTVNFRKNREHVLVTATSSGVTEQGIPILCSQNVWSEINSFLTKNGNCEIDLRGQIIPTPLEYDSYLLRSPSLPKVVLYIESILNIDMKYSDTPIQVTPWTIFEREDDQDSPFGFTFAYHELYRDNFSNTEEWIIDYIEQNNGTHAITDFDEEANSLNAEFPLSACMSGQVRQNEIMRFCQVIDLQYKRNRA